MNKYTIKKRLGVDDLLCEFAFVGNSQGDESKSNSIDTYRSSQGWMSFVFDCPLDEESITKEIQKRKQANLDYINDLKSKGKYGAEYEIDINLHLSSLFDMPTTKGDLPLESYRMIFLDNK
jgi:hypothetical protein